MSGSTVSSDEQKTIVDMLTEPAGVGAVVFDPVKMTGTARAADLSS